MHLKKLARNMAVVLLSALISPWYPGAPSAAAAAESVPAASEPKPLNVEPVSFTKETLPNGLRVIYAPLKSAPVVHVRVLYHVGSRDEKPDRQGFAHMFEHMMFRGSAHVPPEEHMKLIGIVGGESNAFTSFDQTTYVNTVPSNNVEMALYLEADRMASFKVSDTIFQTERKVVSEEWRMRTANPPLGTLFQDFLKTAYQAHSYRWTPIGDMDQLRRAKSSELQEFFNRYYVPNNACLIIAGDIDVAKTKQWVEKYYGWIPKGPDIARDMPSEPEQTAARRMVVYKPNVPLGTIIMGFKGPDYRADDHYALAALGDILSAGRTGRLDRQFVNSSDPSCLSVGAGDNQLEDSSLFVVQATVQQGRDAEKVEKDLLAAVYEVAEKGVTEDELNKVKTQQRESEIRGRQTCTQIASQLGEQEVFGGDADRVNRELPKLMALTPADVQAVAKKFLKPTTLTVVHYLPDPTGANARKAASTQAAAAAQKAEETKNAAVVASETPIEPRVKQDQFPEGFPKAPPISNEAIKAVFEKGVETTVKGVKVVTMTDHRLPLANFSLILRGGGDALPEAKAGLAGITASMLRRGSNGIGFMDFSSDLESRSIDVEVSDSGDTTRLSGSCSSDQLDYAIGRANLVLTKPDFPAEEFAKLKQQSIGGLMQSLSQPSIAATRDYTESLFEGSPLGRYSTPRGLMSLTLEDVKHWYEMMYKPKNAILVISGDVTPDQGKALAAKLLQGFDRTGDPPAADYALKTERSQRKIILVDNPEGKQAAVRLGLRAYDIHAPEKFAGSVAGQILSAGIESRLNKYVRAEKGLTYGCYAYFRPGRHSGEFSGSVDTNPETTAAAVEAMFKVFNDMRTAEVTPTELSEAKSRVAGGMVMEMQTISQQASRRVEQILNDYPIDYYDNYPKKISAVTSEQVRDAMKKFVDDGHMSVVVVAPGDVKEQLQKLGEVEVRPMPLRRPENAPSTQPSDMQMLKPAKKAA